MICPQCGVDLSSVSPESLVVWQDLTFCSQGCLMGATTRTGNSSGIDPSLVAPEDPTR